MSAVAFDVTAARSRFSALDRDLAFFDGPGGSQVPDSVIDAISRLPPRVEREHERAVRDEQAHRGDARGARGSRPPTSSAATRRRSIFGPNMTTLNFALTRALARELREGDEVVVTRLDHDANVSPWLELQHDLGIVVRFADIDDDLPLDLGHLERRSPSGRASSRSRSRELGRHADRRRADLRARA